MNVRPETIVALGTASAAVIVASGTLLSSLRNGNKLKEIHVLVNSRMSNALSEIARLSNRLAVLTGDKDDIQQARDADKNTSG